MTPAGKRARVLLLTLWMLPVAPGCDGSAGPDVSAYAGTWHGTFSFAQVDAAASPITGTVTIQVDHAGSLTGDVTLDDGRQGSITATLRRDGTLAGSIDQYALRGTLTREPDARLRGVLTQSLGTLVVGTITVTLQRT